MSKLQIEFSKNWGGKLDKEIFTTIRRFSQSKFDYYFNNLGRNFETTLKGELFGNAKLVSVGKAKIKNIGTDVLTVDTGTKSREEAMNVFDTFSLNKDSEVIVLAFSK